MYFPLQRYSWSLRNFVLDRFEKKIMLFKRNKRQSVPRQMIWYMSYIYIYIYLYISYKYIYIYIYILYYIIFIYINIYKYIEREI